MTTLNKQVQNAIVKFHINQALKDLNIEVETAKKKVGTNYKQSYSI